MANVFCPCRETSRPDRGHVPDLVFAKECYTPLNSLLFCEKCRAVRCAHCTDKVPVAYFCSQCLMETTKTSAGEFSNKCTRNCLRCPDCTANMIVHGGENLTMRCASCPFSCTMPKVKESLAHRVDKARRAEFAPLLSLIETRFSRPASTDLSPADIRARAYARVEASAAAESATQQPKQDARLPQLAPLRAKYAKYCRVCGQMLADPVRRPAQAKYESKSVARSHLPSLELLRREDGVKLLARSFRRDSAMHVKLFCLNPDVLLPVELTIPPVTADGFPAPLFTVFRESLESRQAFMEGNKAATAGPGWAVGEAELPADLESVHICTSTSLSDHKGASAAKDPVEAWMQLTLRPSQAVDT